MVTAGDYKLILYPKIGKSLLFDLKNDPGETRNLAEQPGRQAELRKLFATLLRLQRETGDTLDLRSVYPKLHPDS